MSLTIIGGVLLLVVAVAIVIYLALRQPSEEELLRRRMMEYGDRETPVTLEEILLSRKLLASWRVSCRLTCLSQRATSSSWQGAPGTWGRPNLWSSVSLPLP